MKAIVDCNSFYCACEKLFQPHLHSRPVVVLSNNDGCIISRSDEAKALGVGMAGPYFKAKSLIEEHNVAVFSSNYNLYGDLSRRIMDILESFVGPQQVEVYSVDEAFLTLDGFTPLQWYKVSEQIRDTVHRWTGIQVSIGVAQTKTLAKLANRLAKKNKEKTGCIAVLDTEEKIIEALKGTQVADIWGIGSRYADKLNLLGLPTAWDVRNLTEEWARKHLGGVVGVRLVKELRGEETKLLQKQLMNKKMIATTRMFGHTVTELSELKEAVATYASRAAEKLRRQRSAASVMSVFVISNDTINSPRFTHGPTLSTYTILPQPTSLTHELIKPAMHMVEGLFEKGKGYKKAGVTLSGLVPDNSIQASLFEEQKTIGRFLMEMVDNINFSMRGDVVKFAASGTRRDWKMRKEFHSPRYTTRWDELFEVK